MAVSKVRIAGRSADPSQDQKEPARGRCAREPGDALCLLPRGGARAIILFDPGGQDLQQAKAKEKVTIRCDVFQRLASMWQLDLKQESQGTSNLQCLSQRDGARQMKAETQSLEARGEKVLAIPRRSGCYPDVDSQSIAAGCDGGDRGSWDGRRWRGAKAGAGILTVQPGCTG